MKKLCIIATTLFLGTTLCAYPMFSLGGKVNMTYPFLDDSENLIQGLNEVVAASLFVDGIYTLNNGVTFGLEGSFGTSISTENNGDMLRWGIAPMVGYTFLDKVFFQALFQPLCFTSTAGLTHLSNANIVFDYKTGIQTYIGIVGTSILGAASSSLGLGAYVYWGHQELLSNRRSKFDGFGKFNFSISLRYTELFAKAKQIE